MAISLRSIASLLEPRRIKPEHTNEENIALLSYSSLLRGTI